MGKTQIIIPVTTQRNIEFRCLPQRYADQIRFTAMEYSWKKSTLFGAHAVEFHDDIERIFRGVRGKWGIHGGLSSIGADCVLMFGRLEHFSTEQGKMKVEYNLSFRGKADSAKLVSVTRETEIRIKTFEKLLVKKEIIVDKTIPLEESVRRLIAFFEDAYNPVRTAIELLNGSS